MEFLPELDVGGATDAVRGIADLRNHLPINTSSSSNSTLVPAVTTFPMHTLCTGPAGLVLMMQHLFDASNEVGDRFTPIFFPSVKEIIDFSFLEGLIALGRQHANFARWFEPPTHRSPEAINSPPSNKFNIVMLTELDNPTVPIGISGTLVARLLYIVRSVVRSRPDLTDNFIKLGGFNMIRNIFVSNVNYSETVKQMFCEVVGDLQNDPPILKKFIELDYISILLSFTKCRNEGLRNFSISLVDTLRQLAPGKSLIKHSKENSCTKTIVAMIEEKDYSNKRTLCNSINELLQSGDSTFKDEFMQPVNLLPFLSTLKMLLMDKEEMQKPGLQSPHSDTWWLAYTMIAALGMAVGGSAERQIILGKDTEVIPLLIDTLSYSLHDETMSPQLVSAIYKSVARVLHENAIQIYRHPQGVQLLFDYVSIFLAKTDRRKSDWEGAWGMGYMAIIQAVHSSLRNIISDDIREQLWNHFVALVAIFESPLASNIPFENIVSMNNYFHGVITLPVYKDDLAKNLQWVLKCCCHRGPQGFPYLTLISDLQSRNGLIHIKFPSSFMDKIDDFCDTHLDAIRRIIHSLRGSLREIPEDCKENLQWVTTKITAGTLFSKLIAKKSGFKNLEELKSNPISKPPKKGSGSSSSSSAEQKVCGNPACYNHQNLKACGRCKVVYYCGTFCQKEHWKMHKKDCK